MNAYFVTVQDMKLMKMELYVLYTVLMIQQTKGGNAPDGRKVKGTIHWVEASQAGKAEVRLYENIVDEEKGVYEQKKMVPSAPNPNSLTKVTAYVEPSTMEAKGYDSSVRKNRIFLCRYP